MGRGKSESSAELSILELKTGQVDLCVVGLTPFVFNAMSFKAQNQLLYPKAKLSGADKATNMKHDPLAEYQNSVYAHVPNDRSSRLMFPASAFKRALASAALDIPGLKKAQIGRLVWVNGQHVDMFGVPQMYMAVVRSAGMERTPDIRTRAILPQWAARVSLSYVQPNMNHKSLATLLAAAGRIVGVGDGRPEKGALSFGQFEVVSEDDPRYRAAIKSGAREAQDRALRSPSFYDLETEKLFTWFNTEISKRGQDADKPAKSKAAIAAKTKKRNGESEVVHGH